MGERILIADDEAGVLDLCALVLTDAGYQVSGVSCGSEAIEQAGRQQFDLFVTDISMPGMSGLEAYETIKLGSPNIVGVAITGYGAADAVVRALELGMRGFLFKPFSPDQMISVVSQALEIKRQEREAARLRSLLPLWQLSQTFMSVMDLDTLLQQVTRDAVQETAGDLGSIMLRNPQSLALEVCTLVGGVPASVGGGGVLASPGGGSVGDGVPTGQCILSAAVARRVVEGKEVVMWQAADCQEPFFAQEMGDAPVRAAMALPLVTADEPIGILVLGRRRESSTFARSDVEVASVLASQAAVAIQNARLFTRLKNAYEKLSVLDHLKSEFLHIAAHELRTPLSIISAYAELSVDEDQPERRREHLTAITRAIDRLTYLIRSMTSVEYLEAQTTGLQYTEFPLSELVSEAVRQLAPLAECKGQSVTVLADGDLPHIRADEPKLELVLQKLITNAISFTPKGGKITVSAHVTGDGVELEVTDTGIGIPESEWEWIFKPFYQVADSSRRENEGMGLGLTIAQKLVQLHGGRIWVESTADKGSTFRFTVPGCLVSPLPSR